MSKQPETIRMHLNVYADFHIPTLEKELDIKWADVRAVWMRWCRLHVSMLNGDEHIIRCEVDTRSTSLAVTWPIDAWKNTVLEELLDEDIEPIDDPLQLDPNNDPVADAEFAAYNAEED